MYVNVLLRGPKAWSEGGDVFSVSLKGNQVHLQKDYAICS